jgi:TolA-binding protein
MRFLPLGRVTFIALVTVLAMPTAHAQMQSREAIALQNQILELRHDLDQMNERLAASAAPSVLRRDTPSPTQPNAAPNDIVATLLDRVGQLEEQVRRLRGRVDELGNQVQSQGDDLNKQIGDLNFRLQSAGNIPNSALTPPPSAAQRNTPGTPGVATTSSAAPLPPRTPELALQQGSAALARRDYNAAEAAAREVLATRGPRAYDAQLLLAQALMGKRDYQQAALAYDDTYNKSRTGSHAQDALLGLASSLIDINEKRAACDTLNKLRAEFPQPRPDIKEAVGLMRQRGGCA